MQELNIKQKWICLVPSSKRNPGKEGAASGGKGKGQSPPQGASLPHSALRGPGASHKPRRRGAVEAHRLHEAGGTAFRAHGVQGARGAGRTGCRVRACLSVSSIPISYLLQVERRG